MKTGDHDEELGKLRTTLAMISLDMAARSPEYGATLARQTHDRTQALDSDDAEFIEEFLHAASGIVADAIADPARVATAAELARGWSGAELADRVRQAADGESGDLNDLDLDLDLEVMLAFAAASVPRR